MGKLRVAFCVVGLLVPFFSIAAPAAAERIPATVRLKVTDRSGTQVRVFDDIQGVVQADGSFAGAVEVAGADWRGTALVYGRLMLSPSQLSARGTTIDVRGALGLGLAFVNGGGTPVDFEGDVCIDSVFDNDVPPNEIPIVDLTNTLFGGSMAASFVDVNGDTTAPSAVFATAASGQSSLYRLFTDTDTCANNVDVAADTIATLYDAPQSFNCGGAFCGGTVAPEEFGDPNIPAASGLGDVPRSLELRGRFSSGPGDMSAMTAVAAVTGQMGAVAGSAPVLTSSAAALDVPSASLMTRLVLDGEALSPRIDLSLPGFNIIGLATLAIGAGASSLVLDADQLTANLPIGPLSLNGGTTVGSFSDFGLPGDTTGCAVASIPAAAPFPLYRALIDPTPGPTPAPGAEAIFPLYPPSTDIPPLGVSGAFLSALIDPESFGAPFGPAPSQVGPGIDSAMRLEHAYNILDECVVGLLGVYVVPTTGIQPSPTPTLTATQTATATVTATPTLSLTPTQTSTPSVTATASVTATVTNTPTASTTPSVSSTPSVTATRTVTLTRTPTVEGDPGVGPPEIPTLSGVGAVVLVLLIGGIAVLVLVRSRS